MKVDIRILGLSLLIQILLFSRIAIANELDTSSKEFRICVSVWRQEVEKIGLSEESISKNCSCAKRRMGVDFPANETEWSNVGVNSGKKELVDCAKQDLQNRYQSVFFAGNVVRYKKFKIPHSRLQELSICQAQGAVSGTYEVAKGSVAAADIRSYVMRAFDDCGESLLKSVR